MTLLATGSPLQEWAGQVGRVSGRPALLPDVAHGRRRRSVSHPNLKRKPNLKPNRISNHYNMLIMPLSSVIYYDNSR